MSGPAYVWCPDPDNRPEILQPRCDAHEDTWTGPETINLEGAHINVQVHNTDDHKPEPGLFELDDEPARSSLETEND